MVSKFKDIFTLHSLKISYSNSIYTKNYSYLYVGCRTYAAPCILMYKKKALTPNSKQVKELVKVVEL